MKKIISFILTIVILSSCNHSEDEYSRPSSILSSNLDSIKNSLSNYPTEPPVVVPKCYEDERFGKLLSEINYTSYSNNEKSDSIGKIIYYEVFEAENLPYNCKFFLLNNASYKTKIAWSIQVEINKRIENDDTAGLNKIFVKEITVGYGDIKNVPQKWIEFISN